MRLVPCPAQKLPFLVKHSFDTDNEIQDEYFTRRKVSIVHLMNDLGLLAQFTLIGGHWYKSRVYHKTDQWFTTHEALQRLGELIEERKNRHERSVLRRRLGIKQKKRHMTINNERLHWHKVETSAKYQERLRH